MTDRHRNGRARRRLLSATSGMLAFAALALLLTVTAAQPSSAESAHYKCSWVKVGKPFRLAVQGNTTYITGSLGIFGQVAPTQEKKGDYIVRLELAGGFVAFRWPKSGGISSVGFFDSKGDLQGGTQKAATCIKD